MPSALTPPAPRGSEAAAPHVRARGKRASRGWQGCRWATRDQGRGAGAGVLARRGTGGARHRAAVAAAARGCQKRRPSAPPAKSASWSACCPRRHHHTGSSAHCLWLLQGWVAQDQRPRRASRWAAQGLGEVEWWTQWQPWWIWVLTLRLEVAGVRRQWARSDPPVRYPEMTVQPLSRQ